MAIFQGQFANVVEWQEYRDDVIFWKWGNQELKKGSKLIIRPGQDAIFLYNGRIEGIFRDEGRYEMESQIIPFLSTLKGFKFGFNSGLRAEVLFVNQKEFSVKWGVKSAVNIPTEGLPGGMPIRAFGLFNMKVDDYITLIDKIAGVKQQYTVDEVRERVLAVLDGLLMRWIAREGKDMFNLQANAPEIGRGIRDDLDMELRGIGLAVTGFSISSFTYPEEIQKRINQTAGVHMVGDVDKLTRVSMADSLSKPGHSTAGDTASSMAGMMAGMQMAKEMFSQPPQESGRQTSSSSPPNPNIRSNGTLAPKFCSECGAALQPNVKFCSECGAKIG